jgi:hypothetical protein
MTLIGGLLAAASLAMAQPPGGDRAAFPKSAGADADEFVTRMMEFDKNKDGKLTRSEVTDQRLHRLIDRADANHDGVVTKDELTTLAAKEQANDRDRPPGFGPPGFPPPPPGGGPGRFMMGPPRPGEILPPMFQQRLGLTPEQKEQLEALQKEVDAKLDKILNVEQKRLLKEMRERGPGGFGPPGRRAAGPRRTSSGR